MKRQSLRIIILFLLVSVLPLTALAETDDANSLKTLGDYLSYAVSNNPQLKAQFEEWKATLEQIQQAKSLDDPKFTYGYFIEEVETRVGPQRQRFGIMQTFPWLGTIEARTGIASAKAKAARQRFEAAKLKLTQQVKENFYEYTYLAVAIEIAKENLELLTHFEEVARTKYTTATATHPDIIRSQVELAKIEDVLNSLNKFREPITAKLNAVLNRKSSEELPWPTKEKLVQIYVERQQVIEMLIQANPELAELDWEIEAAKRNIELAQKKFWPNIGVGVDWIQTDNAIMPGTRDSGKDPVILMFQINIPFWRDRYKAGENQARAMARKTELQKTDAENTKISEAVRLLYDLDDSRRKINLYSQILIPKTEELVQASESAYKAGTVDFLSLIDSQRMLLQYRLNYERSAINYQQKLAELEMLIGKEL